MRWLITPFFATDNGDLSVFELVEEMVAMIEGIDARSASGPAVFGAGSGRAYFDALGIVAYGPGYCLSLSYRGGGPSHQQVIERTLVRKWLDAADLARG